MLFAAALATVVGVRKVAEATKNVPYAKDVEQESTP
jgi:hypothetical protein